MGFKRGLKRPIFVSSELNLTIQGLWSLENSLGGPFFWSMSWERWSEADLLEFQCNVHLNDLITQKVHFWGLLQFDVKYAILGAL